MCSAAKFFARKSEIFCTEKQGVNNANSHSAIKIAAQKNT